MKYLTLWLALVSCLGAWPAFAADDGDIGVTMTVIDSQEDANEQKFVQDIQLPVPEVAQENAKGLGIAAEARDSAREGQSGNEIANQAREQGRDGVRGRSAEARDNAQGGNGGANRPDIPVLLPPAAGGGR